jgi:hypothetical protein
MERLQELEQALIKADAAGNADDARALANEIRRLRATAAAPQQQAAPAPNYGGGADAVFTMPTKDDWKKAGGMAADMGIEGLATASGQAVGGMVGGPPGAVIGGAIGGAGGNILSQARQIYAKERSNFSLGEVGGSAGVGMILGAPLVGAGGKALAREAAKQAGGNVIAKAAQVGIDEGRLPTGKEMAMAGGMAVAGTGVGKVLDTGSAQKALTAAQIEDRVTTGTIMRAKAAGYVIPPSMVNPAPVNKLLESIAGKAATAQEAVLRNQKVTNALARKAIGMTNNDPVTLEVLEQIRTEAAKPYETIAGFSKKAALDLSALKKAELTSGDYHQIRVQEADPEFVKKFDELSVQAAADIEALKKARFEKSALYKFYDKHPDPEVLARAKKQEALAEELEDSIEKAATQMGLKDLVPELRAARQRIAVSHDIERTLQLSRSDVEAAVLGRAYDAKKPLSGPLRQIGRFADYSSRISKRAGDVPTPGVSALQMPFGSAAGAALGGAYGGTTGAVMGAVAGPVALQGASNLSRNLILSKAYQQKFATPFYDAAVKQDFASQVARFGLQAQGR